jgi:hypothetical protein
LSPALWQAIWLVAGTVQEPSPRASFACICDIG